MRYETGSNDIKILRSPDADELRRSEPLHDDVRRLVQSLRTVLVRKYPSDTDREQVQKRIIEELGRK